MNINIVGTGSTGNSIIFDNTILIDTGMPFKYIENYVKDLDAVLLTHKHGDHYNTGVIRKIHIKNNNVKFCCGDFLYDDVINTGIPDKNVVIVKSGVNYKINDFMFSPVKLNHDIPNVGYRLMKNGHKHIHATDTYDLEGISAMNYDSATLEANHCFLYANKIVREKHKDGEFCHLVRAIKTHLSVQKAVSFIKKNKIKQYAPIHIGGLTLNNVMDYINSHLTAINDQWYINRD